MLASVSCRRCRLPTFPFPAIACEGGVRSANCGYPRCDLASGWRRLLDFLLDIFMCGIIVIIGKTPVAPLLLEALSHSASGEFVPSQ
jgi:hypothetical protein